MINDNRWGIFNDFNVYIYIINKYEQKIMTKRWLIPWLMPMKSSS